MHAALLVGVIAAGGPPRVVPAPPEFSIALSWTAPGDDGNVGRAQAFDLRFSRTPITEANFARAEPIDALPTPGPPGAVHSIVVGNLEANTAYFFALKTRDEAGNWSALSNVVHFPMLPATGVDGPAGAADCTGPSPNPARSLTRWTLTLPEAADVEMDVFSVTGQHVRTLAGGRHPAGRSELEWDLRDGRGGRVAAGIYLVRARLGGRTWTHRVTVVH